MKSRLLVASTALGLSIGDAPADGGPVLRRGGTVGEDDFCSPREGERVIRRNNYARCPAGFAGDGQFCVCEGDRDFARSLQHGP